MSVDTVTRQLKVAMEALKRVETQESVFMSRSIASMALTDIRRIDAELDVTEDMITAATVELRKADIPQDSWHTKEEVRQALIAAMTAYNERK